MREQTSVYVSSTFKDLEVQRRVILDVIARLEVTAIGMENYTARDQKIVEKCVADVRASSVYVGIIGWRHGACPPSTPERSFTEAEYDAATEAGIPRLMYFVSDAKRPAECREGDPILRFRQRIAADLLPASFADDTELAGKVTKDLMVELARLRPPDGARRLLLPYLCDREAQTQGIAAELSDPASRPVTFCLVHGASNQCPAHFLDCLCSSHLPECLGTVQDTPVRHVQPTWPEGPLSRVARDVRSSLARALGKGVLQVTDQHVQDWIAEYPGPVLVSFQVPSGDFAAEQQRLSAVIEYFRTWPERQPRKPDLILIWLEHPRVKPGLLAALGLGGRGERHHQLLRSQISSLAGTGVLCVLPELDNVREDHVTAWSRRPDVQRVLAGRDLAGEVSKLFEQQPALPMIELARSLGRWLGGEQDD